MSPKVQKKVLKHLQEFKNGIKYQKCSAAVKGKLHRFCILNEDIFLPDQETYR